MATLRLPTLPELVDLFTRDSQRSAGTATPARDFVREAYKKAGGATADLRRVYDTYRDNERRREAAKG
jgi:hypothetical protein